MDLDEVKIIFEEHLRKKSKKLTVEDLDLVLIVIIRTARDGIRSDKSQLTRRIDAETDELKDLLRHFQLGLGQPALMKAFGSELVDKKSFLDGYLKFLADLAGEEYVESAGADTGAFTLTLLQIA